MKFIVFFLVGLVVGMNLQRPSSYEYYGKRDISHHHKYYNEPQWSGYRSDSHHFKAPPHKKRYKAPIPKKHHKTIKNPKVHKVHNSPKSTKPITIPIIPISIPLPDPTLDPTPAPEPAPAPELEPSCVNNTFTCKNDSDVYLCSNNVLAFSFTCGADRPVCKLDTDPSTVFCNAA